MSTPSSSQKRRHEEAGGIRNQPSELRICNFGENCYRRNPTHFSEYHHPHLQELLDKQKGTDDVSLPSDYKPKIDPSVVLAQLLVLRDINISKEAKGRSNVTPKKLLKASPSQQPKNITAPKDENKTHPVDRKKFHLDSSESKHNDVTLRAPSGSSMGSSRESSGSGIQHVSKASKTEDVKSKNEESRVKMHKKIRDEWRHISSTVPVSNDILEKFAAAAPYNFFLTTVLDSRPTHAEQLSITFSDLLHPSLGVLKASLQVNFMIELDWLLEQYQFHGYRQTPLMILYEDDGDDIRKSKNLPSNIKAFRVKPSHAYGHHHTKMSIFCYDDDSLRVVISTANLIASDWENRTQGLWVSPRCYKMAHGADTGAGDSITEFRADLMRYLSAYQMPVLQEWVTRIRFADFSKVRVCLVGSVPGTHRGPDVDRWGHRRLAAHLRHFAEVPDASWPLFAQCSSIGSLGPTPDSWMCGELRANMAQGVTNKQLLSQQPPFKVIYPSFRNVAQSIHGLLGGDCLPYSLRTHNKQPWFTGYLHEWKSDCRHRSEAMPHIKTYGRASPDWRRLAWFHLSSANLSKAAWGMGSKGKSTTGSGLYIMSYELGVLFLPQLLIGKPTFHIGNLGNDNSSPPFPVPFDVPPTPYGERDKPWVNEYMDVKF